MLTANESFYFYYFILTFLITIAEIPMDIIISNIIECWSGLKIDGSIDQFKESFQQRNTYWAINDFSSLSKLEAGGEKVGITEKLGFSTQYYLLMSLFCLGSVTSFLGLEIISLYNYNPFADIFMVLSAILVTAYFFIIHKVFMYIIDKVKVKDEEEMTRENLFKKRQGLKNKANTFKCEIDVLDQYLDQNAQFKEKAKELEKKMKLKGNI